jgi:filamentous hemagglutinin family protein
MKYRKSISFKIFASWTVFSFIFSNFLPLYADDLPTGYTPVEGQSSYSVEGSVGTLTAVDQQTIGQWESFNIGAANTFNALLPGADAAHLSRVMSTSPSQIFGALNVPQGKFFLVNKNGIFFAPGSQVNAAGLVASTLDINNQDFLNGNFKFFQNGLNPAFILNQGTMNIGAGGAALLAGAVANQGVIQAQESSVVLAAGEEMTLSFEPDGLISVLVDKEVSKKVLDKNGSEVKDQILNEGIVRADGGRVIMTSEAAMDVFDRLVNQRGLVEANTTSTRAGEILLSSIRSKGIVENSGTLHTRGLAAGQKGGRIVVAGEKTGIFEGSVVDASGQAGGGDIFVGGGFQGSDALIRNAEFTFVAPGSILNADATALGDGGQVIVWSEQATRVYDAYLFARGGAMGGNGGLIETSSRDFLEAAGNTINASAFQGTPGLWLLDPRNVDLEDPTTSGGSFSGGNPTIFTPTANNAKVSTIDVETSLNGGTSVEINTGSTGTQNGDITVVDDILKTAGGDATLTLTAARHIDVNNTISSTSGALNVNLIADDDLSGTGNIDITDAIITNGGTLTAVGTDLDITPAGSLDTGSGDIFLRTSLPGRRIGIRDAGGFDLTDAQLDRISTTGLITLGDASQTAGIFIGDDGPLTQGAKNFRFVTDGLVTLRTNSFTTTGDVSFVSSDVAMTSGLIADDVTFTTNDPADTIGVGGGAGTFNLTDAELDLVTASGSLTIGDAANTGGINIGTLTQDEPLNFVTGGDINFGGSITTTGTDVTFTAPATVLTADSTIATAGGDFLLTGTLDGTTLGAEDFTVTTGIGDITLVGAIGQVVALGTLTLTNSAPGTISLPALISAAAIVLGGSLVLTANTTLNAGTGTFSAAGIDTAGFDLTITADEIDFLGGAGSVFGGGDLLLQPFTTSLDINIAGASEIAGPLDLTTTDVDAFSHPLGGFTSITLGRSNGSGDIHIDAVTFYDPTTIQTPVSPGHIYVDGLITGLDDASITLDGPDATTTLNADIITAGTPIEILDNVILGPVAAGYTLDTTLLGTVPTGARIHISGTIEGSTIGGQGLTLIAGTVGDIDLDGAVGGATRVGDLTVTSVDTLTVSDITATSIDTASTGTSNFNGILNTNTAAGISILGDVVNISDTVTTTNNGTVSILNSGLLTILSDMFLDGVFDQSGGGAVSTSGDITTTADDIHFTNAVTLVGNVQFSTGLGIGDIVFDSTIDATTANVESLTLDAGAGNVVLTGAVGGATELGALVISSANNVTTDAIAATSITQTTGTGTSDFGALTTTGAAGVDLNGNNITLSAAVTTTGGGGVSVTNTGAFTQSALIDSDGPVVQDGLGPVALGADITATGDLISFLSAVRLAADVVITSLGGTVIFNDTVNGTSPGSESLTVSSGDISFLGIVGALTSLLDLSIINTGVFTNAADLFLDGFFSQTGGGTSELGADITAAGGIDFDDAIVLLADLVLDSVGADIDLASTVDASNPGIEDLTLAAGAGSIILGGILGGIVRLGSFVISDAFDVDTTDIFATDITQVAGTGTTTFGGLLDTNGALGVNLTGAGFGVGDVTTTNDGGFEMTNSGPSSLTGTMLLDGAFLQNGTGPVALASPLIETTGDTVTFGSATTLTADVAIDTTDGGVVPTGADVTFADTLDGGFSLTINSGNSSDVLFAGAIGSGAVLDDLSITDALDVTFDSTVSADDVTVTQRGILSVNDAMSLTGNFVQNGAGTNVISADIVTTGADISFLTAVRLAADVVMASASSILFSSTVNGTSAGSQDLTLTSTDITFSDIVGGAVRLGALTITNTGIFSVLADIFLTAALTQTGAGTNELSADITTDGSVTFDDAITLLANVIMDAAGGMTFNSTIDSTTAGVEDLTLIAGAGDIDINGALGSGTSLGDFNVVSAGNTLLDANITAASMDFDAPVELTSSIALDTSAFGGDVNFDDTLDGAFNLLVDAGAGTTTFAGAVGSITPLGTGTGAAIDLDSTGDTIFGSTLETASGISADGSVRFNGDVTLGDGDTDTTLNGDVIFGAGGVDIFSADSISFGDTVTDQITMLGPVSIDTTTGAVDGTITFNGLVDGGEDLTLAAGLAPIFFMAAIGSTTPIGALAILSGLSVEAFGDIFADSISHSTSTTSGLSFYHGNITTTDPAGFTILSSFDFTLGDLPSGSDVVTILSDGPFSISHDGTFTLNATLILINGVFSDLGPGPTVINGSITAGGGISFAGDLLLIADLTTFDTSAGDGDITFGGVVDGELGAPGDSDEDLRLIAGTGSILFGGEVGGDNIVPLSQFRLGDLDIVSAGAVTFSEAVNAASATIANSGLLTIDTIADFDLTGAFSQTGTGAVSTGGNIVSDGGSVSFAGDVALTDSITIDTTRTGAFPAGGDIAFGGMVDGTVAGAEDLTLDGGASGDVLFSADAGSATRIGVLTVDSENLTTDGNMTAASISARTVDAMTFNGSVDTNTAAGIDLTSGGAITFGDNVGVDSITTTGTGPLTITNGGLLTMNANADASLDGAFNQLGVGFVDIAADILTTSDLIHFLSAVTLIGDVAWRTGAGLGDILLDSTLDGGFDATFAAGTGSITFTGAVGAGTRLGAILIENAFDVLASSTISSASLVQLAGTGTTELVGAVDTDVAPGIDMTSGIFIVRDTLRAVGGDIRLDGTGTIDLLGTSAIADGLISLRGDTITQDAFLESDADLAGGEGISVVADRAAGSDVIANNFMLSHGGDVTVSANNDTLFGPIADINSNGGRISVTADLDGSGLGALTMADDTLFDAGDGEISLRAGEDVIIGGLLTSNATPTAVSITSTGGGLVDGGDTFFEVDAILGGLTMSAATGIGTAPGFGANPALEINVASVTGTTTTGDININSLSTGILTVGLLQTPGTLNLSHLGTLILGLVDAGVFNIDVLGNIIDNNGDDTNLLGGNSSTLFAGGFIGELFDAIEFAIGDGDLTVRAGGISDGVSVNLVGSLPGDLKFVSVTPGLVLFNSIAVAGVPLPVLSSGFATVFNIVEFSAPMNYFNDQQSLDWMMAGIGFHQRYAPARVPDVSALGFEEAPRVSEKAYLGWTKPMVAPKPAEALTPTVQIPLPTEPVSPVAPLPISGPGPIGPGAPGIVPVSELGQRPLSQAPVNPSLTPQNLPLQQPNLPPANLARPLFQQEVEEQALDEAQPKLSWWKRFVEWVKSFKK